ncbi:hypothetical protein [Mesorhizobium sp. A623]
MTDTPDTISEARTAAEKRERYQRMTRIPFPEAGEGVFIHCTLAGAGKIEEVTEAKARPDESWFGTVERLLLNGDVQVLRHCLDACLKVDGPDGKPVPATGIDLDDPGFSITDAVTPILNVLAYLTFGKSYDEMIAEATAAREAAVAAARKDWQEGTAKTA